MHYFDKLKVGDTLICRNNQNSYKGVISTVQLIVNSDYIVTGLNYKKRLIQVISDGYRANWYSLDKFKPSTETTLLYKIY